MSGTLWPENPLIAAPEPIEILEGAGLLSDLYDLGKVAVEAFEGGPQGGEFDPSRIDTSQAAAALAGVGLSALGAIEDPFQALASAGVGWMIEHIAFLREPLDQLAGNPNEIKAHAQTWHNVGVELTRVADDHLLRLSDLEVWQGEAADAYRSVARRHNEALLHSAKSAEELATKIITHGTVIATVRSLVRDMIADFVVKLAEWLIPALVGATATAGATLASFIAAAVAKAVELASRIATVLAKLLRHLEEAGLALGKLAGDVEQVAASMARGANGIRRGGAMAQEALQQLGRNVAPAGPAGLGGTAHPGGSFDAAASGQFGGSAAPAGAAGFGGTAHSAGSFDTAASSNFLDRSWRDRLGELYPRSEKAAKVLLEPFKQAGSSERDQEKWTPL